MKKFLSYVIIMTFVIGLFSTGVGAASTSTTQDDSKIYSVLFNSNNIPEDFEETLKDLNAEIVYKVPEVGFVQVKGGFNIVAELKKVSSVQAINPALHWAIPEVEKVELEEELAANAEEAALWGLQWDIQSITNNGASYELGTGSHDVVVGIIDTGIDRDHPDLVGNLMPGSKNYVPEGGYAGEEPYETGDQNDFDDKHGHGTHVAGSIAANGAMLGVAPNVGIRSYRVFGLSSGESAWIIDAMIDAVDDGVDVMSMSLGGFDVIGQIFSIDPETGEKVNLGNDVADFIAYRRALKYAQDKDVLVVVASGNDAINCTNKKEVMDFMNEEYAEDGLYFVGAGFNVPAWYPNVVTVSATGPEDVLSVYSNYGPGFIDIAAPGGDARMYYQYLEEGRFDEYISERLFEKEFCLSTGELGDYYWSIGTSMSTPKVSAVAALIIDKYGKMDPKKVAEYLYKNGVDPVSGNEKEFFGNGHLNAHKALQD